MAQQTNSQQVDVLAVMAEIAEFIADADPRSEEIATADRLLEASAAVAGLVTEFRQLIADADDSGITAHYKGRGFDESIERARAALARIAPNELHDKAAELRGRGE